MSTRSSQYENSDDVSTDDDENKAVKIIKKRSRRRAQIKPTPIMSYKLESLFPTGNPLQAVEVIKAKLRSPEKPPVKKTFKVHLKLAIKSRARKNRFPITSADVIKVVEKRTIDLQKCRPRGVLPQKDAFLRWRGSIRLNMSFDPFKVYNFGEPGCGSWRGMVQDFNKIREYHLKKGTLFVDPVFPPAVSSITYSGEIQLCKWVRPLEIMVNAKFHNKGYFRFNVNQGLLGDTWFLSSIATLSQRRGLLVQVIPQDQSLNEKYAGIFHFRFWQYGRWIDVVVDDLLPINNRGQLLFTKPTDKHEFWPALLEKAVAKLNGSYECLSTGNYAEGIEDFTGGITETYDLHNPPANLFNIMLRAYVRGSIITVGIVRPGEVPKENVTDSGLVEGHAYTITRVLKTKILINYRRKNVELVRLRKPWGDDVKWNGAWSYRSREWLFVDTKEKNLVGLNFDHEGEFWMRFSDLLTHCTYIDICNLSPECSERATKWEVALFEGEWTTGVTAGGCSNFQDTFARNPQYLVTFEKRDDRKIKYCTIVISLTQKHRSRLKEMGAALLCIGFVIYKVIDPGTAPQPLDKMYLYTHEIAEACEYNRLRSVTKRLELRKGTYCIIPTTFNPDEDGEFVLRVFTEQNVRMKDNVQDNGQFRDKSKSVCLCSPKKNRKERQSSADESATKLKTNAKDNEEQTTKPKSHPEPPKIIPEEEYVPQIIKDETTQGLTLPENIEGEKAVPLEIIKEKEPGEEEISPTPQDVADQTRTPLIISSDTEIQKKIETKFLTLSGDDEEINWENLQKLLDDALKNLPNYKTLESDVCRSLLALYDHNQSGKLSYEEFCRLCEDITTWTTMFYNHTTDTLSGEELMAVMNEVGFAINSHTLNLVFHRFGNGEGGMDYQDAMMCLIRVKNMITGFHERIVADNEFIEFKLEDYMDFVMYS